MVCLHRFSTIRNGYNGTSCITCDKCGKSGKAHCDIANTLNEWDAIQLKARRDQALEQSSTKLDEGDAK